MKLRVSFRGAVRQQHQTEGEVLKMDEAKESALVRAEEIRRRPETVGYDMEHFNGASGGNTTREALRLQHEAKIRRLTAS